MIRSHKIARKLFHAAEEIEELYHGMNDFGPFNRYLIQKSGGLVNTGDFTTPLGEALNQLKLDMMALSLRCDAMAQTIQEHFDQNQKKD